MAQDNMAKLMAAAVQSAANTADGSVEPTSIADQLAAVTTPSSKTRRADDTQAPPPTPTADKSDQPPRRVARRRPAGPVRGKIAANDDVPSIGGLIYALEQKPSTKVFRFASMASGIWAVIGLSFGAWSLAPLWMEGASLSSLMLNPIAFYTTAAIAVPIAIIWLLATLNWHIASLALKSSTMTEVAIRLAEPDRAAEQSIASLGQAVRRQVSFMNDAVSRALGRAGELEALVHNQVADLERSYEQNERRIRGLIQELTGERHALLNTSTSVTDTLKSLGTEIPMLIDKLSTQQVTLAGIIKGAGENLTALEGSLATSTGRFENAFGERTVHLQKVLEDYTGAFSVALDSRTEQIRSAFDGYLVTLDTTLGNRTGDLQTVFEEYARALDTTLSNRSKALDMQLIERTRSLDDAFQKRLDHFDEQIVRSTTAIDSAVSEKAQLLTSALDIHARTFRETISRQAVDLDDSVVNGINAVRRTSENITRQTMKAIEGLSHQSSVLQNVAENLFTQIHGVTDRFENQGQQIMRAATVLDDANLRIDTTLQTRHADLSKTLERLSGKADEFGRTIEGYSTNIDNSLSSIEVKARAFTEEMRTTAEQRSRDLMSELEQVKQQTEAESQRTLDSLRSRFNSVSGDLSKEFSSLSQRLATATDETRQRAAQAAETLSREHARIREETARLPASTRDSAEAMRRALQDQVRALEQLTQISTRTTAAQDVTPPENNRAMSGIGTLSGHVAALSGPAPKGKTNSEGWSLGDLLARASHDEEALATVRQQSENAIRTQRAPAAASDQRAPQSNAGFKLDVGLIAKAVDPATASTIWSRLRAGQRNVMVRSIYAPEVRNVFDTLSQRIKTDRELAQTVLRYLSDFETIIKDTDTRDPSGRSTQTQLTSETGRVYLFLAHAAGRIS